MSPVVYPTFAPQKASMLSLRPPHMRRSLRILNKCAAPCHGLPFSADLYFETGSTYTSSESIPLYSSE